MFWTPGRNPWTPARGTRRPRRPFARTFGMADGDLSLDASGNRILDASGNAYLKCCCAPTGDCVVKGCNKVRVVLSGLPTCAAEANGEWVLCSVGTNLYRGCTPNFLIEYSAASPLYLKVLSRSFKNTYYRPGSLCPNYVGTVFQATAGSLNSTTGVMTFATADPVDADAWPDNGCDYVAGGF